MRWLACPSAAALAAASPKAGGGGGGGGGKKGKGGTAPPAAASAVADDGGGDDGEVDTTMDLPTAMAKHVAYAVREFAKLRGSTASPSMLDDVMVPAYGQDAPLKGLAHIALKNPNLIVVDPFDDTLAAPIAEAIRASGLNLNPSVDGRVVRVPIPKVTKETREATLKLVSKVAEAAKTRIRRVRQAAMDKLKKVEGVSPDVTFRELKDIQAITNTATDEVAKLADKKKAEVEGA